MKGMEHHLPNIYTPSVHIYRPRRIEEEEEVLNEITWDNEKYPKYESNAMMQFQKLEGEM